MKIWEIILAVLPVFAAMAVGLGVRRLRVLSEAADASLLRLTIQALTPCLILHTLVGNPALMRIRDVALAPVIGFFVVALSIGLCWVAGAWLRGGPATRGTFAVVTGLFNYGFIALPLAMRFFDRETVGMLFVFNVGVEAAMWIFGALLLSGAPLTQGLKRLVNGPLIAIVIALVLNFSGLSSSISDGFMRVFGFMGDAAIPLSLILTGAVIYDHLPEFAGRGGASAMVLGVALRLGVLPLLMLAVACIASLPLELRRVVVLEAAMPAAVFPVIMAKHYGGDTATAMRVIVVTCLLALATTPLWLRFGMGLLGAR